jgi:DNA-binding IclR family transcriptional regulator
VVQDVGGVAMAIPKSDGLPSLALSIAALASQADDRKIEDWKWIIREEVEAVLRAA